MFIKQYIKRFMNKKGYKTGFIHTTGTKSVILEYAGFNDEGYCAIHGKSWNNILLFLLLLQDCNLKLSGNYYKIEEFLKKGF